MKFVRSPRFWEQLRSSMGWCEIGHQQLLWLQKFYFQIADAGVTTDPMAPSELPPDVLTEGLERLGNVVPLDWPHFVSHFDFGTNALPTAFYECVFRYLVDVEVDAVGVGPRVVSYLELTLALAVVQKRDFPHWNSQSSSWTVQPISSLFTRPTVAVLLSYFRRAIRELFDRFDLIDRVVDRCSKPHLGLHKQMGGIKIFVGSMWPKIQAATQAFCQSRPVRRACDLVRPLPAVQ